MFSISKDDREVSVTINPRENKTTDILIMINSTRETRDGEDMVTNPEEITD